MEKPKLPPEPPASGLHVSTQEIIISLLIPQSFLPPDQFFLFGSNIPLLIQEGVLSGFNNFDFTLKQPDNTFIFLKTTHKNINFNNKQQLTALYSLC